MWEFLKRALRPVRDFFYDAEVARKDRQACLAVVWRRLFLMSILFFGVAVLFIMHGGHTAVVAMVFAAGNIGGYVGLHRSLAQATDQEVRNFARSWLGIVVPSFIGGILAIVLYLIFLSGIVGGHMFPTFDADKDAATAQGIEKLMRQHGHDFREYAKLLVWCFIAGFNQKYVVDILDSLQTPQGDSKQDAEADKPKH
ncbi:MAG TPA: hypothetical protein VM469_10080 [Pseudoxanthomonas sp.]|nr:hypothetical protein [Pseudoxanthomonas sp.]